MVNRIKDALKIRAIWKYLALLSVLLLCIGARPGCRPPPTLDCNDFFVTVAPGTCVDIANPCSADGSWAATDHFRLYQEPDGLYIGAAGPQSRQLCAADTVAPMVDEEVEWLYTEVRGRRTEYGEGFVYVTTVLEDIVSAIASATPSNILLNDTSQLDVVATGGTPPYTYLWMSDPAGQIPIGDTTLKDPVVMPLLVNTTFTVTVTDSVGYVTTDSVLVAVGMGLTVSAIPDTIALGESSQLMAEVVGGAPPYTFDWVPMASLDDSTIYNPVATPAITTTYQVTVNDSGTNVAVDTVTVTVGMELEVTATASFIEAGDTSILGVIVAGGMPPYTCQWDLADGLDPAEAAFWNPVVNPAATETYTVTVTDDDGETIGGTVEVTVNNAGPEACFNVTPDPPDLGGDREEWNAGCSTGDGLEYRWVFSVPDIGPEMDMCYGDGAQPDGYTASPCSEFTFSPNLEVISFDLEGPTGYTRRTTLYIKDADGNIDSFIHDWDL